MKKIETVHHKAAPEHMDTPSGINLPNPLAEIHSDLYNSMNNKEDIIVKKQRLHEAVNVNDLSLFTPSIIKAAARSLKSQKNDVSIQYESNSLTNVPDVLYDKLANLFKAFNGTRQGLFYLSPILFTVYMDGLLIKLRESGFGCYIGDLFLGAVAYCDDFLLLSPTRNGLQNLLHICEKYAEEHNISFSTNPDPFKSKSKCIFFSCGRNRTSSEVVLNYEKLPWVSQVDQIADWSYPTSIRFTGCRLQEVKRGLHRIIYGAFGNFQV